MYCYNYLLLLINISINFNANAHNYIYVVVYHESLTTEGDMVLLDGIYIGFQMQKPRRRLGI